MDDPWTAPAPAESPATDSDPTDWHPLARWLVPIALIGPWLTVLGVMQTSLLPPATPLPDRPRPELAVLAIVAAVIVRLRAPSLVTHVAALAVTTGGVALLAAQIGAPFANATADYCGDFCRTAIMARAVTFVGWPIATAAVLSVLARRDRDRELASWTRPWARVTLVLGLAAAVWWWRTILPNG